MLDVCAQLLGKGVWFTSHVNENVAEIARWPGCSPAPGTTWIPTAGTAWSPSAACSRTTCIPDDAELAVLAEHGASVSHCPTSNCALGSGLFPLRRHIEHGVRVALGSDVGAGAGLFLPKEALQAYFIQQLLGPDGLPLTPVHLLYLATRGRRAGAGPGRPGRRLRGGQGLRCGLAAPGRGQHAGGQPQACLRHH